MAMCTKDSLTTTFRRIFTMARTLQDVLALCREKDVKIVDFKMTDIDGRWRHLSIPVDRLNEDHHCLWHRF